MSPGEEMEARARSAQLVQRDQMQAQAEQRQKELEARTEQRRQVVRSVLEPEALERLNRIGLVKPEKQTRLEELIFANVQRGVIKQKIDQGTFVDLLKQIDSAPSATAAVSAGAGVVAGSGIQFRRRAFDDDDVDLDNLE
jgi:DNA-binding TFAR19-related protein (PDSD5 family)